MITYANIPLLTEDADGQVERFLGQHLTLADLRLFGETTTPRSGSRNNSQGGNSHLVSLPTPNYPDAPALRINSLYWPTGAGRCAWFLGLVTDSQLLKLRDEVRGPSRTMLPKQLVLGDSANTIGSTIPADGYSGDSEFRQVLSTEMWMLTPRCISGGERTASGERVWLVPFVDARYHWQTKPSPSYLYANVFAEESYVTGFGTNTPQHREIKLTFAGRYSRRDMTLNAWSINGGQLDQTSGAVAATITRTTTGSTTENEEWLLTLDQVTGGTFTLTLKIPSPLLTSVSMGSIAQTTDPIPFDASPEEIEEAIHALGTGRVRWESLIENLSTAIGKRIAYEVPSEKWGWPDRVELDRRFESIGMVLDAVAHSTGRRFVRDIDGTLSLLTAEQSNDRVELNTSPAGGLAPPWRLIAGRETIGDVGWSDNGVFRKGQFVPESINVVFRDLTRSTRNGLWGPNGDPWNTDGGRLVVNVSAETADTSEFSDLASSSSGGPDHWSLKVPGWTETIHTPTLSNTGRVSVSGDAYTDLAGYIAGDWYDWRRRLFDLRYVGVMPWRMTGFDDHVEFSIGQRIGDPTTDDGGRLDGYGGFIGSTRIQSMPMNFGCSDLLNQIGTLCPWTEDIVIGEIRETLEAATHPRLLPSQTRAWAFLPPMVLQGEEHDLLWTHKRAITVTSRDIDATANPGVFFEAHSWFCENELIWLGCNPFCAAAEISPSMGGSSLPDATCPDSTCDPYVVDGSDWCLDNGSMTPPDNEGE
jgi:hypothetical protein